MPRPISLRYHLFLIVAGWDSTLSLEVGIKRRRSEKEIKDKSIIKDVLDRCHIGRLGTIGRDGYPMVKPLNFAYHAGMIYFHTVQEGEKIEAIKRDNRICFGGKGSIANSS